MSTPNPGKDIYAYIHVPDSDAQESIARLKGSSTLLLRIHEEIIRPDGVKNKTDRQRVMLANLVWKSSFETRRLSSWLEGEIDQICLSTRNLFEMNLRVRCLLKDSDKFTNRFFADAISSEIKLLKKTQENIFKSESSEINNRIKILRKALNAESKKEYTNELDMASLADCVGATREYQAFYSHYSKYIHPSAYALTRVMANLDYGKEMFSKLFLRNAQTYALDTIYQVISVI